jgi:hypothetical protein
VASASSPRLVCKRRPWKKFIGCGAVTAVGQGTASFNSRAADASSHPASTTQFRREETPLLFICCRSIRPHHLQGFLQRSPGSALLNEETSRQAAATAPSAPSWVRERTAPALGSATTRHFPPTSDAPRSAAPPHLHLRAPSVTARRCLLLAPRREFVSSDSAAPIARVCRCQLASAACARDSVARSACSLTSLPALRPLRRRIPPPRPTHLLPRSRRNARVQEPTSAVNSHQPQPISPPTFHALVDIRTGH